MLHCGTSQAGSLREAPDWMAYTASLGWKQDMVRVPTVGMFALQSSKEDSRDRRLQFYWSCLESSSHQSGKGLWLHTCWRCLLAERHRAQPKELQMSPMVQLLKRLHCHQPSLLPHSLDAKTQSLPAQRQFLWLLGMCPCITKTANAGMS